PANFSPKRKYPLVLGNSPYSWTPFPMAAANAGYFFVTVDRPSWTSPMDDWGEKLLTTYNSLLENHNIETNRIFLCARSMESSGAIATYSQKPSLWKGLILFDPTNPLDGLSVHPLPKIFIASGELEKTKILTNILGFRDAALKSRIPITVVILKGA